MAHCGVTELSAEEQEALAEIRKRKEILLEEIQHIQDELEQVNFQIDSLSVYETDATLRLKMMNTAKKKFNFDPKKGLQYMVDNGLLKGDAQSVADFLYEMEGIKKSVIGDYLGEKTDFNVEVLDRYVKRHNFFNLPLVDSLRIFLWHFRLPGEAQKIDRIMEHFSKHYCQQNPSLFEHSDTCYTLCYATIMLNTSLHNPSVKERMTLDNFIHLTSTINAPKELVTSIFNSIRLEPFKMPEDSSRENLEIFFQADKQGWLLKQGSRYKTWSKRWFVLNNKCLYYFEYSNDKEPKGIIPLEGIRVRAVEEDKLNRPHTFEIYSKTSEVIKACKTDPAGKLVEGQHSVYRMAASNHEDMLNWISAIQRSINKDHYFNLIQSRRKRMGCGVSDPTLNKSQ